LLEKSFDKIKENNWVIEERKEMIESIMIKYRLKQAFKAFHKNYKLTTAIEQMVNNFSTFTDY
jgi:hypothetical protein